MIGSQLSIPELTAHLSQSHTAIGMAGEILVARSLEMQGYQVRIDHHWGDLTAISPDGEISFVEVKTARRNKDKRFHFTLWKHYEGRLRTNHKNADFVVLLCVMKTGTTIPFVIPTTDMGDRKAATIGGNPLRFNGWISYYRSNLKKLRLPQKEC